MPELGHVLYKPSDQQLKDTVRQAGTGHCGRKPRLPSATLSSSPSPSAMITPAIPTFAPAASSTGVNSEGLTPRDDRAGSMAAYIESRAKKAMMELASVQDLHQQHACLRMMFSYSWRRLSSSNPARKVSTERR